jgi:hypothetical protein
MHLYAYGNIKNANYLDRQSADDVNMFSNMFNSLITKLISEGKFDEGKKVASHYFEVIPDQFHSMYQLASTFYLTENLYRLNDAQKANQLINKSADYMTKELTYLADVSVSKNHLASEREVQFYMTFLGQMVVLTQNYKQPELSKRLEKQYNELLSRFSPFVNG